MATTYTYSGSLAITAQGQVTASVDQTGTFTGGVTYNITFDVSGGTAPTITGYMHGQGTASAGDILVAHATDPLGTMGDAGYAPGFTVAGSKVKLLIFKNTDSTNTITVTRGTSGLAIFSAAGDGIILTAGGIYLYYDPTGAQSGALTTTTNDKITLAVGGGTPTFEILIIYGP